VIILDEKNEELLGVRNDWKSDEQRGRIRGRALRARARGASRARELELRLDSELVVRQLDGSYKVKHPVLIPLFEKARKRMRSFDRVTVTHVPRKENAVADKLANASSTAGPMIVI